MNNDWRTWRDFGDLVNDHYAEKSCSNCGATIMFQQLNVNDTIDGDYELLCDLCKISK